MKNKIFQSRDLCLRTLDTNSACAKSVRRNEEKMEQLEEKKINKTRIILYLAITFVITFAMEIFVVRPLIQSSDESQALLGQSIIAGMMYIPTIGVIATRLLTKERFAGNLFIALNIKKNLKYYGMAWFGMAFLTVVGTVLYFLLFQKCFDPELGYLKAMYEAQIEMTGAGEVPDTSGLWSMMLQQVVFGILFSPFLNIINCFGEEWGWRGYLLPKLMKQFKIVPTLLISGVIWGLWHAPLIVLGHNYGVGYPGYPVVGILAMCVFCVVMGTILSYLTIHTKSCIPAAMAHGMINGFSSVGIYFTSLTHPYNVFVGPTALGIVGGIGFIAAAGIMGYKLYQQEKSSEEGLSLM